MFQYFLSFVSRKQDLTFYANWLLKKKQNILSYIPDKNCQKLKAN